MKDIELQLFIATKEKIMHLKNMARFMGLAGILLVTTSCIKYHDVVRSEFPQGTKRESIADVATAYRRMATVYDEFQTKGVFNALWLSDVVRTTYVKLYGDKRGMSAEAQEEMLKRQLEENKHWVALYVLSDIRDKLYTSLTDQTALWSLYLSLDGTHKVAPESIKEVELEPEIQRFFGSSYSFFKGVYLVKFAVNEELAAKIARNEIAEMRLMVNSSYKTCWMSWTPHDTKPKKAFEDEDFYWG